MRGTGIVAQHSPQWKGRRRWAQIVAVLVLAAAVSLPFALIVGAALTPLLWKLEPVLGLELAGHSGPSDWILMTLASAFVVGVTTVYTWLTRPNRQAASNQTQIV